MPLRVFFASLVAVFLIGARPAAAQETTEQEEARPRNVILMVSDGTGPATLTMARDFARAEWGQKRLALDSALTGSTQTYATDSRVTDSAAGATAFSTGVKTYNGAIAVDTLKRPVATVLEAAEARGMATGLVVTSRLTHATPAAFAAHVPARSMEDEIARQMLGHRVEVLLGGGRRHFRPEADGGARADSLNLLDAVRAAGYAVATDRAGFDSVRTTPLLGLFAESHMNYEIDRDPAVQPSLAEMTRKALDLLASNSDARQNGFFLLIEGSRIDHAGHANDAAAHVRETLAYDEAVAAALDFARRDGRTLVVSTSDHETGGLSLGRDGVYDWKPGVLARVKASQEAMLMRISDGAPLSAVLKEAAGIESLTVEKAVALGAATCAEDAGALGAALSDIISRRAFVGWTTTGHTAVDVNLYAFGPGAGRFAGHFDNTHIGRAVADLLGFDLPTRTQQLREDAERTAEVAGPIEER